MASEKESIDSSRDLPPVYLSDDIEELLEETGLSSAEFARRIDVAGHTVERWRTRNQCKSSATRERIYDTFGHPRFDVLGESSTDQVDDEVDEEETVVDESAGGESFSGSYSAGDIAAILEEEELTQAEFAEEIGVTAPTVSQWKNGNYSPSDDAAEQIFAVFGAPQP